MPAVMTVSATAFAVLPGAAPASAACSPIRYVIYDNANMQAPVTGQCLSQANFGAIKYGSWPWETFNNNVSSVVIAGGVGVSFYDDANYANFLVWYQAGAAIPYVGNALNDRFNSAWIG